MEVKVVRQIDGYVADAPVAQVERAWSTSSPVSRRELANTMLQLGVHSTTVSEAIWAADRVWLRAHPEEEDDGELLMVHFSERGYWAIVDQRAGVWSTSGRPVAADELVVQLTKLGFEAQRVKTVMDEAERVWRTDRDSGRDALGHVDVIRTETGYLGRSLGRVGSFPDKPISRGSACLHFASVFHAGRPDREALRSG